MVAPGGADEQGDGDRLVGWRLAPGVSCVEGKAIAGAGVPTAHAYTLVLPSGHRYQVTAALYHLALLLAGERSHADVVTRLSAKLGRPLGGAEVTGLIRSKLEAQGLVVAR